MGQRGSLGWGSPWTRVLLPLPPDAALPVDLPRIHIHGHGGPQAVAPSQGGTSPGLGPPAPPTPVPALRARGRKIPPALGLSGHQLTATLTIGGTV